MTPSTSSTPRASLPPPATRSELFTLLSEACELEHGLACSYLFAAFSLKQDASEGGMTTAQVSLVRQWAAQIFFVAAQEMLHLAQAWNLLVAAGGAPYYLRPNFPQGTRYYPLHLKLSLEPFGADTLRRFVAYETPVEIRPERAMKLERLKVLRSPEEGDVSFHSIGQLYERIRKGFGSIPDVFVADPARQTARDTADFPDLVTVTDLDSAHRAIDRIMFQGEGVTSDRTDCHFGIFLDILEGFCAEQDRDLAFRPAREVLSNPTVLSPASAPRGAVQLEDDYARQVAGLFDSIYSLMLRMLSYAFSASGPVARRLGQVAIRLMPTAIKPVGEMLMTLPSAPGCSAGPGFGLERHVQFPDDRRVALALSRERLSELAAKCDELSRHAKAPPRLARVGSRLREEASALGSAGAGL